MCEPSELQALSEGELVAMSQALAVEQEAIREKRLAIASEMRNRAVRLAEAKQLVARLESGDAVVQGQVLEASAGVN